MSLRFRRSLTLALGLVLLTASAVLPASGKQDPAKPAVDPALFESLKWREIGPYRGGRSAAVTGIPGQPMTYYFGATGGGVWKTTDGGENWKNVSDGFFGGSIGSVAVSERDPNVVYVGTGEVTVRGNVSEGDGMWKSVDAGKSWRHVGLEDSRHITRVRIDPRNPDVVYAAVLGHLFGPNEQRGVYRSKDGGRSWERVLYNGPDAGAVDLEMDPSNPRVLYASTWRIRRAPYSLESGGTGSGLWKSTDGGDTWIELSRNKGMPKGTLGIIGVTVSPTNPDNVYAIVEADEGGVFRSRDGGATWTRVNESRDLRQRAWYYSRIYADPKDEETLYVVNVRFHRSKDGGKSFTSIRTPHGDNHDLWIAPEDPLRMIEANDGGVNVSFDGGQTWSSQDNQPTAQFYRVSTDNDFPYNLLGAQQDNSAVRIAHRSSGPGISEDDWEPTAGGESGYIVAKPDKPDIIYGGSYGGYLTMINRKTQEFRDVNPWPDNPMGWGDAELKERFQWNFPIFFSPHNPNRMYAASQHLLMSDDGGASWTRISPDLTRNDQSKMAPSGGPITKDNTSVEYYGTIFYAIESPHTPGVFWVGSDDGMIHLSRDGGNTWNDVTPKNMPTWIMINCIEANPFREGSVYVAGTMYKSDDQTPYLYRTDDWGKSWSRIDSGIPRDHFTRAIRADSIRKGLLYAGTQRGIYVSFDDGAHWQPLQLNLPIVPVTDLAVRDGSLIAATEGRGFWMLDDLTLLHQTAPAMKPSGEHLFTPAPAWRIQSFGGWFSPRNQGTNPPDGVVVHYDVGNADLGTSVKLEFLDSDGKLIRAFHGKVAEKKEEAKPASRGELTPEELKALEETEISEGPGAATGKEAMLAGPEKPGSEDVERSAAQEESEQEQKKENEDKIPSVVPGMNRFAWNFRYPEGKKFDGMILWGGGTSGPRVVPGDYQVRLTVGDTAPLTAPIAIKADPRSSASQADLQAQFDFLYEIWNHLNQINGDIGRIRKVRTQINDLKTRMKGEENTKEILDAAEALDRKMTAVEEALYQTKNRSPQDPLNYPIRLNDKLASLADSASTGDFPPTAQARAVKAELEAQIDDQLAKLKEIWETDLPNLNRMVQQKAVPVVVLPEE